MKRIIVCLLCIALCLPILVSCNTDETENDLVYYENIGYLKTPIGYLLTDIENYSSTKLVLPERLPDGEIVVGIEVDDFSKIEELYVNDSAMILNMYNAKLRKVHLGASTLSHFYTCIRKEYLEEITISENHPRYYSENNCIIQRDTQTVIFGCKNSIIPEGVRGIGLSAFSNAPITSITIPSSVTKIEVSAFAYCTNLKEIFLPTTVKEIGSGAFYGTPDLIINCEADEKPIGWDEQWCQVKKVIKLGAARINWGATRET